MFTQSGLTSKEEATKTGIADVSGEMGDAFTKKDEILIVCSFLALNPSYTFCVQICKTDNRIKLKFMIWCHGFGQKF